MTLWNLPYSPPLNSNGGGLTRLQCPRCRHVADADLDGETCHGCLDCLLNDNVAVYLRLESDGELNPPTPRPDGIEVH